MSKSINELYENLCIPCKRATPKDRAYRFWFDKLLTIVISVFKYDNLPPNLPYWEIEKRLILGGRCFIFKNEMYGIITSFGATSGVDIYNNASEFNYAQAVLGSQSGLKNMIDGVIIYGSSVDKINGNSGAIGRRLQYYADLLSDIDVSRRVGLINNRATRSVIVKSDNAVNELRNYYRQLTDGELAVPKIATGVLDATEDINKIRTSEYALPEFDSAQTNVMKMFYSDFGIAYNTDKRERLITDEIDAECDSLDVNIADMLNCRVDGFNAVNNLFGSAIVVGVNNDNIT